MVGRLLSFETVPFSGEMLVFEGVHFLDCNVFLFTRMWLFWVLEAFCLNKGARNWSIIVVSKNPSTQREFTARFSQEGLGVGEELHFDPPRDESIISHLIGFFSGKPSLELSCSGTMLCNRWVRRSRPGLLELLGTVRLDRDF